MTTIENNTIHNLEHEGHCSVKLHNGDEVKLRLVLNLEGMPTNIMAKLVFETLKIKFRPFVRDMTSDELLKTFHGKVITWREMMSKNISDAYLEFNKMTVDELENKIQYLKDIKDLMTTK